MTLKEALGNKLLIKQLAKHLPPELWSDERLARFVQAVNDSYNAYEKDKTLADHAFQLNEEEYVRINAKLKLEVKTRRHAINLLKEAIARIDDQQTGAGSVLPDDDSLDGALAHLERQLARRQQMEAELGQRAKQFQSLSENAPGVIFEYEFRADGTAGYSYISPAIEKIFGIKPSDFSSLSDYVHPDQRDARSGCVLSGAAGKPPCRQK